MIESYRLAPSTEYGNSGLDDYGYVAFLWGSAQLTGAAGPVVGEPPPPTPPSPAEAVTDEAAALRFGSEYVFAKRMGAVHRRAADEGNAAAANRGRRPVWRHSYQLWNLTAFPRWDRVNECLAASFRRHVLDRFEVVGRLAFGELLNIARNPRPLGVSFYDCVPPAPDPASGGVGDVGRDDVDDVDDDDGGGGGGGGGGDRDRGSATDLELADDELAALHEEAAAEEFE